MSVFWDEGRAALERFCEAAKKPSTSGTGPFNLLFQPEPDQLLRTAVALAFRRARLEHVYSILRGKDLKTGVFSAEQRDRQFATLKSAQDKVLDLNNWTDFLKVLLLAGYRSAAMISSQNAALYTYAMMLIGKYDFGVDHGTLRSLLARWFFMSSLTGRYTDSPEARMEQDLALLRGVHSSEHFVAALDDEMKSVLTNDYWTVTLPSELGTASAQSPGMFAFFAALNILGAPVLYSTMKVSDLLDPAMKGKKSAVERHHLFPSRYLQKSGIVERRDIHQVANYALVEWQDNISISDQAPAEYVPRYEKKFSKRELETMYELHGLPPKWYEMNYHDFLGERRRRIAMVIRKGFESIGK